MFLEKLSLEGEVALVTGGGTGLGKAMCHALARAGADIVVAARRPGPIEETAAEVSGLGRRAIAVSADVTDSRQVNEMVARALSEFGKIDILVNNAGIVKSQMPPRDQPPKLIWEITDEDWHLGMDTNLTGTFFCSRAVARHMVERKKGRVINIASVSGLRGRPGDFMYCTAKAGVISLARALALTWARDGIRVNCIIPGGFGTTVRSEEDYRTQGRFIPVGRVGVAEELGPLLVFLASAASDYVTGEVFIIDGGAMAGGYAPTGYAPVIPI